MESTAASFSAPSNPNRVAPIRKTLGNLVDALLAHENLPESKRADARYLIDNLGTWGPRVSTQGSLPPSPSPSALEQDGLAKALSDIGARWGWQAWGYLDEPSAAGIQYFDTWVKFYNDPAVKKALHARFPNVKPAEYPVVRSKNIYRQGLTGSRLYEVLLPISKWTDGEAPDRKFVLVVMPQGKHTWIATSFDEKALLDALATIPGPAKTLAEREGLEVLRQEPHYAAGFFTLRHVLGTLMGSSMNMKSTDVERTFSAMPHHGESPIFSFLDYSDAKGPRVELTMLATKEAVQDVAAAIPMMLANSILGGF